MLPGMIQMRALNLKIASNIHLKYVDQTDK